MRSVRTIILFTRGEGGQLHRSYTHFTKHSKQKKKMDIRAHDNKINNLLLKILNTIIVTPT